MTESEAVAYLRTALTAHLRSAFGSYEVDRDDDFVVRRGSASVFIRPLELDNMTLVRIWAITNVGVSVDGGLTRFLAIENAGLAFGKFSLSDDASVHLSHTLLGDFMNEEELSLAVAAVAETANDYDDRIKSDFGGRLFTEAPDLLAALLGEAETAEPPSQSTVVVRGVFGLLALVAAIGGAIYAYTVESSIWLSLFVAILALNLVGRGFADLVTDPHKVRRALYFLLYPGLATGILCLTHEAWDHWWLSSLLGLIGAAILNAILAPLLFPNIHREETLDSARRLVQQFRPGGGAK